MKITYHLGYETIVRRRSELVHLAILFRATKQASGRSSPFAFGLALDTSTSMEGNSMEGKPLEHAKEAAQTVITHLSAEDRISVVTFSDTTRTVVPLQLATDKPRLQALIASIEIEGSTNLTAGWMLGRDEVAKTPAELPRKVLLLTDGQTNTGITEPAQIRQITGQGLEQAAVRTSCLGFGDGYNEDLLNDLAKAGGGALHDADSPEKFPGFFQQELDSVLKLSAENVRVRLKKLHSIWWPMLSLRAPCFGSPWRHSFYEKLGGRAFLITLSRMISGRLCSSEIISCFPFGTNRKLVVLTSANKRHNNQDRVGIIILDSYFMMVARIHRIGLQPVDNHSIFGR